MAARARKFRIAVRAILAVGLSAAAAIYIAAASRAAHPAGYDPNDSRQYLRQMQVYGGTANVVATDIREWIGSLGHGKRLAATVAVATLALAGIVWFFGASGPGSSGHPGGRGEAADREL
ncbi:MAG: hypothetical protein ABR610_05965 [Thermoanaerobaculia bacterium]